MFLFFVLYLFFVGWPLTLLIQAVDPHHISNGGKQAIIFIAFIPFVLIVNWIMDVCSGKKSLPTLYERKAKTVKQQKRIKSAKPVKHRFDPAYINRMEREEGWPETDYTHLDPCGFYLPRFEDLQRGAPSPNPIDSFAAGVAADKAFVAGQRNSVVQYSKTVPVRHRWPPLEQQLTQGDDVFPDRTSPQDARLQECMREDDAYLGAEDIVEDATVTFESLDAQLDEFVREANERLDNVAELQAESARIIKDLSAEIARR
jgi:hypothetical protein